MKGIKYKMSNIWKGETLEQGRAAYQSINIGICKIGCYFNFNITTYLFYFTRPLFQITHIRLSILYYNFIKIIFLYQFFNHSLNSYISLFPQPIFLNLPPPPTKPSQRTQSNTKYKTRTFYHQFQQTHKIPPSLNINSNKPTKSHRP